MAKWPGGARRALTGTLAASSADSARYFITLFTRAVEARERLRLLLPDLTLPALACRHYLRRISAEYNDARFGQDYILCDAIRHRRGSLYEVIKDETRYFTFILSAIARRDTRNAVTSIQMTQRLSALLSRRLPAARHLFASRGHNLSPPIYIWIFRALLHDIFHFRRRWPSRCNACYARR